MPQCLVCSGQDVAVYLSDSDEGLDASKMGSSRTRLSPGFILRCRSCGFAFRQSRFSEQQLADLYREMDPRGYQAELRGRVRTASRHLRIVTRNLRRDGVPGELLDIGCASGVFLAKALDAGWQVSGIEPSESLFREAAERIGSRGIVLPVILEKADFGGRLFDVITLWDVLEHVVDPMNFLARCRQILKPDGFLFLNVPDLDSLEARLLGRRWPLLLPEHLNYFNRSSLRLCARKCGFQVVRFGRRRSHFSVQYVLYRLAQHHIPLTKKLLSGVAQSVIGRAVVPVSLGETYAILRSS